jgi:hypothetical protein
MSWTLEKLLNHAIIETGLIASNPEIVERLEAELAELRQAKKELEGKGDLVHVDQLTELDMKRTHELNELRKRLAKAERKAAALDELAERGKRLLRLLEAIEEAR